MAEGLLRSGFVVQNLETQIVNDSICLGGLVPSQLGRMVSGAAGFPTGGQAGRSIAMATQPGFFPKEVYGA